MLFPQFTQELPPSLISQEALAVFGYKFLHPSPSCTLLKLQRWDPALSPRAVPARSGGTGTARAAAPPREAPCRLRGARSRWAGTE